MFSGCSRSSRRWRCTDAKPRSGSSPRRPSARSWPATSGTSTRSCPTPSRGPRSTRPSTPCCWKTVPLEVWSVPLRHRVPCAGFLFREKEPPLNVEKFKIAKYGLSIAQITAAKRGEDDTAGHGRGDSQCRVDLPPLCAALVRLPLGHELLGQGRRDCAGESI